LADKYGQMIGTQETAHSRVRSMLGVAPRSGARPDGSSLSQRIEDTQRCIDAMLAEKAEDE